MENINKIIAITLDRSFDGNGGNCKVIGVEVDNEVIVDTKKVEEIFHTSSVIFSHNIYDYGVNIQVKDLIEIIPSKINFDVEENRNIYVALRQVNKIGVPVIDIPTDYIAEDYLDLEKITYFLYSKNLINEHFTRIYLCDNNNIFGPFKIENKKVSPILGKETSAFEYHIEELIEDDLLDYLYLTREPHTKIKSVDCSTPSQLVEFLKDRISIDRSDLNLIVKVVEQISLINNKQIGLDAVRLKRAEKYLNQLTLSFEQLHKLGQNKEWAEVVKNSIIKHKEDFEAYFKKDFEFSLVSLKEEFEDKKVVVADYDERINSKRKQLENIHEQLQDIESRRGEIINNIKILTELQPNSFSNQYVPQIEKPSNAVEYLNTLQKVSVHTDLYEFYDDLKDQYKLRVPNQTEYENGLIILKESRFLIAVSIEFVLNLLSHLGNVKIAIQHTEADWLKFNSWRDNGLLSVIKKASADNEHHYFYVLQDFNVASFECYGKPILDISNKIRFTIDGSQTLPSNLSIILIRTDEEIDDFGFALNESTFRNWKCLPGKTSVRLLEFPTDEALDLDKLNFNNPVQDYSDRYF